MQEYPGADRPAFAGRREKRRNVGIAEVLPSRRRKRQRKRVRRLDKTHSACQRKSWNGQHKSHRDAGNGKYMYDRAGVENTGAEGDVGHQRDINGRHALGSNGGLGHSGFAGGFGKDVQRRHAFGIQSLRQSHRAGNRAHKAVLRHSEAVQDNGEAGRGCF